MSKRTGRKPKRERTSKRRTRRHSSTSETSADDVPPKTRASSRVDEAERKVALTIKLPKPEGIDCSEENSTGMWKVECSNGSDGDIQKLKISLRRSPKDLLREQAAEAKYSAERKEKEAACSSVSSSALDGSVSNHLEQLDSTVAVEETEQDTVNSDEQVQVVIPTNEPLCSQDDVSQLDNDQQMDSGEISNTIAPQEEPVAENISTDNIKFIDEEVGNSKIESNEEMDEDTNDPTKIAVQSINPSEDCPDYIVHPTIEGCEISQVTVPILEEKSISFDTTEVVASDIYIPIALSENVPEVELEPIECVRKSITFEAVEEKLPIDEIDDQVEESNKNDINDSEQMEDVVQLTVESPDLVDEDETKPVYEDEPKPVDEDEPNPVDEEKTKPVKESCPTSPSATFTSEQIDDKKELEVDESQTSSETPKILSSHPKRKWGFCKTRTPITISPFTLGVIIESNGDSIGDNGEYRSEEGEIQRTDSDEEQDVEEPMETNDTMLIDHEAVDYEAPDDEEEEKSDNEDSKLDSKEKLDLSEEANEVEPKKKSSVKRMVTTSVIHITNLVRPFTVGQLRDLLQRTGKIVANGFWIDTIKSQCIVEYENEDQAIETVYALNESQWPSTNPKFLKVVFANKEELTKALNGTHPERLNNQKELKVEKPKIQVENHIILREWDRGKLEDMNGEKEDKPIKRKISDDPHTMKDKKAKKYEKDFPDKHKNIKSKTPERIPTKSLDELFRKTKTTPTLYWSPLSTEQIAEKEDQRRKHLAEMERSQKTDRRRRDNNHYPRRR